MSGAAFGIRQPSAPNACPCGSGRPFAQCCRPIHLGQRAARTAEELMRSRYSAFATGNAEYLVESWHPLHRPDDLRVDPAREWVRLEIVRTLAGGPADDHGVVEYRAHSRSGGRDSDLHETSRFERLAGRWVYVDGDFAD